ncbi:hypothetical protein [Nocardia sp. CNY236]|uniref:hypothetical protein n=1 Tax=Nocardia sp. CNY236 TaxID=1169152 RepID=UPI000491F219|nr:hypothetical protein [Nocardia sp. CNY236]
MGEAQRLVLSDIGDLATEAGAVAEHRGDLRPPLADDDSDLADAEVADVGHCGTSSGDSPRRLDQHGALGHEQLRQGGV